MLCQAHMFHTFMFLLLFLSLLVINAKSKMKHRKSVSTTRSMVLSQLGALTTSTQRTRYTRAAEVLAPLMVVTSLLITSFTGSHSWTRLMSLQYNSLR